MDKILTVSIAAYNVEKFLSKTLDSLVCDEQIMKKLDIIIENDGSTDKTREIAQKYVELYPDSIRLENKKNGGYGSTINNSIKIAKGKYFKQLDGDDWFKTENLGEFVEFLEKTDSDLVISPFYFCYENGKKDSLEDKFDLSSDSQNIDGKLLNGALYMHELAVKTSIFKDNNVLITEKCFYTDLEYVVLPLIYSKTISKFSQPIYCYRIGVEGQSISVEGMKKHYRDAVIVAKKLYKFFYQNNKRISTDLRQYILNEKILQITRFVYSAYAVLGGKIEYRKELVRFDKGLKKHYPDIYEASKNIRIISFLRNYRFIPYPIRCALVKRKVINEINKG